ncbi:DUF262 domain-containing protein [Psychrobacter glacincola]|uniref:DUF262 domain-containing protein n=1 Tax=Psychrobacter glacincola TaxID=56810 RepID=A0ABW1W789_9GAMM|nr:DUF262 domain-containing protein [Psychrobacter glacincola]
MTNSIQESISIRQLLSENQYKIPVYQRNFDWGEPQIQQLIDDIQDYTQKENNASVYYIGSLVIHQKTGYFEILDGQQRFTTLCLLAIYLKYRLANNFDWFKEPNLSFESRSKSEFTINKLFDIFCRKGDSEYSYSTRLPELIGTIDTKKANPSIVEGFKAIDRVITKKFGDDDNLLLKFASYLTDQVKILPVLVPKNTDVTHYFEVMNNRGEQLEKHEVVKANLLSVVQKDEQAMATIHKVWLACADMSRYVQLGFSVEERKAIFGETAEGFKLIIPDGLLEKEDFGFIKSDLDSKNQLPKFTLNDSISKGKTSRLEKTKDTSNKNKAGNSDEGKLERFTSVIDFPNFLIQVLRIYMLRESENNITDEVKIDLPALDDKELINAFKTNVGKDINKVKNFVSLLLKLRYLFDHYIVKRDRGGVKEDWSLKRYKFEDNSSSYVNSFGVDGGDTFSENWRCMTLLSAFHVSYPTNSRKNWLSAVLYWLDKQEDKFSAIDYLQFLESLAKYFMINRYLVSPSKEYVNFMYNLDNSEKPNLVASDLGELLKYGKVAAFVFNYLDYLLLKDDSFIIDDKDKFRFSFKSSVEHFSPQTSKIDNILQADDLHRFGNLCLMSSSENSSLSNDSPREKVRTLLGKRASMAPLSLKLELMMKLVPKEGEWLDDHVKVHEQEMINILKADIE